MKKLFLAIAIVFSASITAQTETKSKKVAIPTNVKEAFSKDFPEKKAKWGMEDGNYEAEFKIKGSDASAIYDKKGKRKALEIAIKTSELPSNALEYLKKNYPTNLLLQFL